MKKFTRKSIQQARMVVVLTGLVLFGFFIGARQDMIKKILSPASVAGVKSVDPKKLTQMLKQKNFTLINVHTPYEGEIAKTDTFIPYSEMVANSTSLPSDKNALVVLYCKTGRMSEEAVQAVEKLGYTNVMHLAGGMDAWQKQGGQLLIYPKLMRKCCRRREWNCR